MTLLILGLLSLSALALLGAIFFLYRYLMRSHLFPQLPRVWRVEKMRFFLCSAVFVVCFAAFLITGWMNNQAEQIDESVIYQTQPTQNQPSFDGGPPISQEHERVLPPRTEDTTGPPAAVTSETRDPMPEPPKPEAPRLEAQPEATSTVKPEPGKPEESKPEPGKPEPGKPEPGKPAPGKPEQSKPEPGKPQPGKPDKDETPQPKPYVPGPADLPTGNRAEQPLPFGAQAPAAAPSATPSAAQRFSVCVASYATEAGAQSELKNHQHLGQAQIVAADIPGKGRWYRICVNQYATQAEAQAKANAWRASGAAKGAFVVRLP